MTRFGCAPLEAEFKHNTSIGANGEILYDAPIEIKNKEDLNNYGITWNDCRTLNFHGSEKVTVFFIRTKNRALAEYLWSALDTQHSRGFASVRCMIPGKRKLFIKCPDTNSCAACPNKAKKRSPIISWDDLTENGYEPIVDYSLHEQVEAKLLYESIKAVMDTEDTRIAKALEMKVLLGFSVKEIAAELGVSEPRTYQLLSRGKEIGIEYRANNS